MISQEILEKLKGAFPKMFVNDINEAIIEPHDNIYFCLINCTDERDVMIKLIEYCSRLKEMSAVRKNYLMQGINNFCKTRLSLVDMHYIYQELGCGVNHDLAVKFVDSDFNMGLLDTEYIPSWFKGDRKQWELLIAQE